ncbi:unnamed protein product, partial [Musa hybrid cultivar]
QPLVLPLWQRSWFFVYLLAMTLSVLFALLALLLLGLDEGSVHPASANVVEVSADEPHISISIMAS